MRIRRKRVLLTLAALLAIALFYCGWLLLLDGRAPAQRPELIVLPVDAPPPPDGYPTANAAKLDYLLGRLPSIEALEFDTPTDVQERLDVPYGETPEQTLRLDLYSPRNLEAPVPGVILIHGGSWYKGDKRDYRPYALPLAQQGYVVASIGYRFTTVAPFPAQVEDAKCAVRWMRKHAAELHVEPDRIAAIGGSAGGYLSLMLGLTANDERLEGSGGHAGVSSAVQAVVDIYGPIDLTTPFARSHDSVQRLFNKPHQGNQRLYEFGSPISHVDAGDPPILIIQGTVDTLVKVTQSDALAEKLQQAGLPYWYDRLDGWPHSMDLAQAVYTRCLWMTGRFLETHL